MKGIGPSLSSRELKTPKHSLLTTFLGVSESLRQACGRVRLEETKQITTKESWGSPVAGEGRAGLSVAMVPEFEQLGDIRAAPEALTALLWVAPELAQQ